ncbi:MAG TPA: hypothetical protein ENI95_07970, partial [Chloroflexi bacterium]|nr:hypothetical protein [Chloroflexota bacterium]
QDEGNRAYALVGLAPHLPEELLGEGLEAARSIEGEWHRAEALVAFLPHLKGAQKEEALRALRGALAARLWRLQGSKREEVLRFLAEEKFFSPPAVPAPVLAAIARHIVEISREWRWG